MILQTLRDYEKAAKAASPLSVKRAKASEIRDGVIRLQLWGAYNRRVGPVVRCNVKDYIKKKAPLGVRIEVV